MARVRDDARYASRQEEILAEAARVFRERGYKQTTMDDIAEELGQTKASIYYYFDSKEELLFQICERAVDAALAHFEDIDRDGAPAAERFTKMMEEHFTSLSRNADVVTVFLQELWRTDHPRAKEIRSKQRRFQGAFEDLIVAGQRDGSFRSDLDARLVVFAFLGMSHAARTWMPRGEWSSDEVGSTIGQIFAHGIFTEAPGSRAQGADGAAAANP